MLGQAKQYLNEDPSLDPSRYLLLRADVGRLPFATGSGAAGCSCLVVAFACCEGSCCYYLIRDMR